LKKVITHIVIPALDQVEDDVKDTVYQTAGIAFFVREISNQVGNDVMDKFLAYVYLLL